MDSAAEMHLRKLIMAALAEKTAETGFVTRKQLEALEVEDEVHRIIDRSRGIWNPAALSATLSVVSSPSSEYSDADLGNLFRYDYRKGSTNGDNRKLRKAYEIGVPIILLRKIKEGQYVPVFPVYVVGDDLAARQFVLALDESLRFVRDPLNLSDPEREYAERVTKTRLHQAEFRGRVLQAYKTQCTVCNLRYGKLLDAAHITPDSNTDGLPLVTNGLSLCKLHHSAYDNGLLGISPDYVVHIDAGILAESDGPMLRHGLQEMHGRTITTPPSKQNNPDRDRLAIRFARFGTAVSS